MNDNHNPPWRGRNQNNFQQPPNPDSGGQNQGFSYQLHSRVQVRSFSGGQESDSTPNQFLSIQEQRSQANQYSRQRSYGPHRNYNRGNYRGYRRNYNPNPRRRNQGSDSESVSSNESQGKKDFDDSLNHFPDRSMGYGYSSGDAPNRSHDDINLHQNIPCHEQETSRNCVSMNYSVLNSGSYGDEKELNKNLEKSFGAMSMSDSYAKYSNDKFAMLRNLKEHYEQMLQNTDPRELILDCRQHIDDLVNEAIAQNYKYIFEMKSRLSANSKCKALELHQNNLQKQQTEFEATIAKIKGRLSSLFVSDVQDLWQSTDAIKEEVRNECRLFKRSLPIYAFKSAILEKIKENQVTIVTADSTYLLNILLPVFVKKEFPNHFLVCCETSEMLCARLKRNVFHFMYNKDTMDSLEERNFNKEVHVMLVEEILNWFSSDYTVDEKNMLVIVNLPLKRSIGLDIVLANLKDMLLNHDEARLVLLASECENADKYEIYFGDQDDVSRISLPNLILPVKTIWKSLALLPTDDYITEVVKTALSIHTLNDYGDILAFLPTLSDIKSLSVEITKTFSAFQYDDFECVIVHENSTGKYGLDLFGKKTSKKRTIFLATDCAEMLIIPTVCFVIDSGLKKENMFDVSKKLDVLTTTFISRDKCKLRKSLAGVFSDGVCYRLYNKEDYCREMPSSEHPEIVTVNPFNSMIKVFQHRPSTATTVEFVESLPETIKENALRLLKKYNAVKDNVLTELGKNIVKLPFPANYAKLILLGIEWGLAFESVVLVAFFSVKGRVFEYSTDPETQKLIDAVKLQLIQSDSDTLSYLFIYKTWLENNKSQQWCSQHYINPETLKSVSLKVNEICQIVGESIKENIAQEFSTVGSNDLSQLLFECFQENLCVFTGHYKSGYRILSSHCIAFLHPSSIICQMENLPQFIIFDHMISSTRDFLFSITTVSSDLVMQALKDLTIDFDYSDMFEKSLVQTVIEPVGERMIKQVLLGKKGKKLKTIEDHIKKHLSTTSLVIEPIPDKGRVLVYALESQIEEAVDLVNEILKTQFEEMVNAEQTRVLELKRGLVKVPLEVRWVKGASVVSVKTGSSDKTSSVTLQNNLEDEDEENPSDQLPAIVQQSINLIWTRRCCNGKGFIKVSGKDFVHARKLAFKKVEVLGSEVLVQVSKFEPNQLYVSGLPPEIRSSEVKEAFSSHLHGIDIENVELKYTEPFETSLNALQEIKDTIEELCRNHTDLSDFSIVIPPPKQTATIMKAYVNVSDDEDVVPASVQLANCTIGEMKLISKAVFRSIIKCKVQVCEALKDRFFGTLNNLQKELKQQFTDQELFEFTINKISDDMAAIKMLSNRREILETLQRSVNELLEGQLLNNMFNNKLSKIFCHGGHMWLQNLETNCGVHIVEDYITKTLRLYGSDENCYSAKERIHQFLEDTENEVVRQFLLSPEGNNRKLLKAVIIEYGANLEKFVETCELQSANLHIRSCALTAHGSRESIERAEDALNKLSQGLDSSDLTESLANGESCPVCGSGAMSLTIRLELCGHLYCSECIQGLVDQAVFPLKCCSVDCDKDIVLDDICKTLGDDSEKIKALLHKAMNHYIKVNQAEVFNCPAPDCSMFFYKKDLIDNKINCPLCQNDICRQCNAVFHQGLSCDMYQGSKIDSDYSFKVWQKSRTEVKVCPKCKSGIEKNGGCMHMTCTLCGSHICWQCMELFPDSDSVYDHLPICHMYGKV